MNYAGSITWHKVRIDHFFIGTLIDYPTNQILFSAYDYAKRDFHIFSTNRILKIEKFSPADKEDKEWEGFK